jgi:hypothetical protein
LAPGQLTTAFSAPKRDATIGGTTSSTTAATGKDAASSSAKRTGGNLRRGNLETNSTIATPLSLT